MPRLEEMLVTQSLRNLHESWYLSIRLHMYSICEFTHDINMPWLEGFLMKRSLESLDACWRLFVSLYAYHWCVMSHRIRCSPPFQSSKFNVKDKLVLCMYGMKLWHVSENEHLPFSLNKVYTVSSYRTLFAKAKLAKPKELSPSDGISWTTYVSINYWSLVKSDLTGKYSNLASWGKC